MDLERRDTQGGSLGHLRREMDDLFNRFFEDWPLAAFGSRRSFWPAIDVTEQDDKVIVEAELPGMTAEDIELTVLDNTLTLSGEKKEHTEQKGENYFHVERRHGCFKRSIQLPTPVDADKVEANYRQGVLTIALPKDQKSTPKRIQLK